MEFCELDFQFIDEYSIAVYGFPNKNFSIPTDIVTFEGQPLLDVVKFCTLKCLKHFIEYMNRYGLLIHGT